LDGTSHLGAGEVGVLTLALESNDPLAILDDALARRWADRLNLPVRGTLGLLLDGKHAGLICEIKPLLDQLQGLGFRLHAATRNVVLKMAGE
jgi:predicted nucleic acid-binding protein